MKTKPTPFVAALRASILQTVKRQLADGCDGMSLANLRQMTPTPSPSLVGAPLGTNAIYYYNELFAAEAKLVAGSLLLT